MLLAIDPGTTQSAWLEYAEDGRPVAFAIEPNDVVLDRIRDAAARVLAIESIASYGMAVGAEVFETCVWSGRFVQRWQDSARLRCMACRALSGRGACDDYCPACGGEVRRDNRLTRRVYRRDVKLHLCGSARAKDANVRQALIDRYGPGKAAAIGLKATPGPLHGVSSHVWAALAVAVTVADELDARAAA